MPRLNSYLLAAGLMLVQAFLVLSQGGYQRLYWIPAAMLLGLLGAWFLAGWNHGWRRVRFPPPLHLPLLGFLGWAAVSWIFSVNREETGFEVARLSLLGSVYFLTAAGLEQEGAKKALVYFLAGIAWLSAGYGLAVFFSGRALFHLPWVELPVSQGHVSGTFRNHNHFAGLMEMGIFLTLGLIMAVPRGQRPASEVLAQRLFLALPCAIMLLALILSLSRGGWLSFLLGLGFFLLLIRRRNHPRWPWGLALTGVMLVVISVFIYRANREPLLRRLETIQSYYQEPEEITLDARLSIWKSALTMIRDHPLTGTGWGTFRSVYPAYRRDYLFYGVDFAHNDYLQIAAGMGLPGLGWFLFFVVMLFRHSFQVLRHGTPKFWARVMPGILAGLFSILTHELVDFGLMLPANAMVFFSLAGIAAGVDREQA